MVSDVIGGRGRWWSGGYKDDNKLRCDLQLLPVMYIHDLDAHAKLLCWPDLHRCGRKAIARCKNRGAWGPCGPEKSGQCATVEAQIPANLLGCHPAMLPGAAAASPSHTQTITLPRAGCKFQRCQGYFCIGAAGWSGAQGVPAEQCAVWLVHCVTSVINLAQCVLDTAYISRRISVI